MTTAHESPGGSHACRMRTCDALVQHCLLECLQHLRRTAACIIEVLCASHLLHQQLHPLCRALRLDLWLCLGRLCTVHMGTAIGLSSPCNRAGQPVSTEVQVSVCL